MLSLFPQLFSYQEWAPFILRLSVGFIAIGFGYPKLLKPALTRRGRPKEYFNFIIGLVEFCAAILLIAGFLTQIAAGLIILAMIYEIIRPGLEKNYKLKILLIVSLVAIMFLGPGLFSIDLPL